MTDQLPRHRPAEDAETRALDRNRRIFLLARAQLAAGRSDLVRVDAARRKWRSHELRFS